jgi:hypothetical protein
MLRETCEIVAEQLGISKKDLELILNNDDVTSMKLFIRMYKVLFTAMSSNKPYRIEWFHTKNNDLNNRSPLETCKLVDGIQSVIDCLIVFALGH